MEEEKLAVEPVKLEAAKLESEPQPVAPDQQQHATLQSVFLYEKQIPAEFGWVGEEEDGCTLYRDITDFVVFHKSKGQVPLESMQEYNPTFIKGECPAPPPSDPALGHSGASDTTAGANKAKLAKKTTKHRFPARERILPWSRFMRHTLCTSLALFTGQKCALRAVVVFFCVGHGGEPSCCCAPRIGVVARSIRETCNITCSGSLGCSGDHSHALRHQGPSSAALTRRWTCTQPRRRDS
jgi:hypothetical protein